MFRRICILALSLALSVSLRAAVEQPTDPAAAAQSIASRQRPTPPNNPAIPTPPPSAGSVAPAEGDTVRLQFPNSDVVDVLRYYEDLTGKKLVLDNNVVGKVNIFISGPVSREEAIRIIEMNLLLNGYTLVPAGEDIVKVIGPGKSPRSAGVPIISDEADIPEGDHVISYLFKLRYADPQELQQVLGQYLAGGTGQYTSFLALPKSSSILVTENSSVIRSLVKIIEQVDVAPAQVESAFIKLERADASKVVDMLKDIFEKGTQGTTPGFQPGVRPVVQNAQPQVQPENNPNDVGALLGLSEDSVIVGKIKLAADVRTNRIHVITRPINMPFIRKLIAEFDANVEFAKPVTRPLRYISASDTLPVLVQALTEPGTDQQGNNAGGGGNNPATPGSTPLRNTGVTGGTSSSSSTASDSTLNISEELSTEPVDTTPKAVTIGNAKIIADQRSNSIIILGNREVVVKVEKILDQMDVRAPQVALSTVIGELGITNDEQFGVDYFLQFKNKNLKIPGTSGNIGVGGATGLIGASNSTILDPASLINFTQLATAAATGGANVYLSAGNTLSSIVHLLESTGRFRTISRPMVFTSNNKKAIIASGQEIPVPVSTISSSTGGGIINTGLAQQSNIQFKKIALQLEVVPLINSDKEVSLDILQKVDSVGQKVPIDGNQIPTVNTRYIRTNVNAPNGATIVLGGLIMDSKSRDTNGIPILSRIPVVGSIFRQTAHSKSRTELIVLMRPEVTLTPLHQQQLREKTENKTHFGPEIDQDDCIDCPPAVDGKQTQAIDKQLPLPPPDLPPGDQ